MYCLARDLTSYNKMVLNSVTHYCRSYCASESLVAFHKRFSAIEQEKILNTLNGSDSEVLQSFNVAQNKIKSLEKYKKKRGLFKTLDELLDVDGLGVKSSEKLCHLLMTAPSKSENHGGSKKIKQFVTPPLPSNLETKIGSTVGIHITPIGVSWAKILKERNELTSWGFTGLPQLPKKTCPIDVFDMATNIVQQLPGGDIYVIEAANGLSGSGQKQASPSTSFIFHIEFSSMIVALLNTSKEHNMNINNSAADVDTVNCIYYLKTKLPARLFRTLVGNECVSNIRTVQKLLEQSDVSKIDFPSTPITVKDHLTKKYYSQSSSNQELLGQALMLTLSFVDLFINKNVKNLKFLMSGKK